MASTSTAVKIRKTRVRPRNESLLTSELTLFSLYFCFSCVCSFFAEHQFNQDDRKAHTRQNGSKREQKHLTKKVQRVFSILFTSSIVFVTNLNLHKQKTFKNEHVYLSLDSF